MVTPRLSELGRRPLRREAPASRLPSPGLPLRALCGQAMGSSGERVRVAVGLPLSDVVQLAPLRPSEADLAPRGECHACAKPQSACLNWDSSQVQAQPPGATTETLIFCDFRPHLWSCGSLGALA